MGLFNKLVNLLSDEEEIEETEELQVLKDRGHKVKEEVTIEPEEPKKEEPRVEQPRKVVNEPVEKERGLFQSPDTFKFPVFKDDEIETTMTRSKNVVDIEKPVEKAPTMPMPTRRENSVSSSVLNKIQATKEDEHKNFRPSPVISPIYGILDKNYSKEDVVERKEVEKRTVKEEVTVDKVRRKAYGTLEDDLEDTLMSLAKKNMQAIEEVEKEIDSIDDPKSHIEKLLNELERTSSITVGDIEDAIKADEENDASYSEEEIETDLVSQARSNIEDELETTKEVKVTKNDEELENDLFNLIDSMYDEGDEN